MLSIYFTASLILACLIGIAVAAKRRARAHCALDGKACECCQNQQIEVEVPMV